MHTLTAEDLTMFTGTEQWYRHGFVRSVTYTDGIKYMAEHGGAYWLIDEIVTAQLMQPVRAEGFQVWTLTVNVDKTATLECGDGNGRSVYRKKIEWTDFPLTEVKMYCTDSVILLPSEY